jgi:hypothetical protein
VSETTVPAEFGGHASAIHWPLYINELVMEEAMLPSCLALQLQLLSCAQLLQPLRGFPD